MHTRNWLGLVVALMLLALTGCAEEGDPVATLETYLEARVNSDVEALQAVSCAAREGQAVMEASSFEGRNAEIRDLRCQAGDVNTNDDEVIVSCEGAIVASYQGEEQSFPLTNYRMVREGGEWRYCGEA